MTVENISGVSVLASGFRTKEVSIYQCKKQIKPKWGRSNNELQHFTHRAERVHHIILLSNLSLMSFGGKKLLRITFFMLLGYFSIQLLLIKLRALGITSSSEFYPTGLQLSQLAVSQGNGTGGCCFTMLG